jgi:hypothetical protein
LWKGRSIDKYQSARYTLVWNTVFSSFTPIYLIASFRAFFVSGP